MLSFQLDLKCFNPFLLLKDLQFQPCDIVGFRCDVHGVLKPFVFVLQELDGIAKVCVGLFQLLDVLICDLFTKGFAISHTGVDQMGASLS